MRIYSTDFNGNPNIGLFAYCNDKFCLVGADIKDATVEIMEKVLNVPVHRITLAGTNLIGVFCVGNSNKIIVPEIVFDSELAVLDRLKIKYEVIKTKLTALGNNILCNDNGCLVNPEYSVDTKKIIRKALDVPLKPGTIARLDVVGALAVLRGGLCIVARGVLKEEVEHMEELLQVKTEEGTVNMGSPFVGSGIICNSHGAILSSGCGGPEKAHIGNVLGIK